MDSNSLISGFTITNGHASLSGDLTNEQSGGGIWCQRGGAVFNCLVVSNFVGNNVTLATARMGGGVYGGVISNCTLAENFGGTGGGAGGGAVLWNCLLANNSGNFGGGAAQSVLYNCRLLNNSAVYGGSPGVGGGAYACVAYNCLLAGSTNVFQGGGAYFGTNYNCTISGNNATQFGGGTYQSTNYNCFITGNNSALGGGGTYSSSSYNCVISGNNALAVDAAGGGDSGGRLVNCTVSGNTAEAGGGVYSSTVFNSIIYFNNAQDGSNWFSGALHYCCTTPLAAGPGNLTNDPVFVDAADGDFQLGCGSPCIDAGLSNSVTFVTTNDIRGVPRPLAGNIGAPAQFDLGAYEYDPATDETPAIHQVYNFNLFATAYSVPFVAQIGGCPDYFWWDFGDGVTVTNQINVTHAWTSPGTYNIRLLAWFSSSGQTLSATDTVQVVQQPIYYANAAGINPVAPYSSWFTAATSLQQAIADGSVPGRLVLATNGNYIGAQATGNGTLKNGVALTNSVIIQSVNGPQVTSFQSAYALVSRCCYVGSNSIFSGFTVFNGATMSTGDTNRDESGGGFYCEPGAVVSNCIVSANMASFSGGGGFQGNYYNCVFTNNIINRGSGFGCGVVSATLYDCLLVSNRITTSSASGGGVAFSTLYNSALLQNRATMGGGAFDSALYGCTVAGNVATVSGGGVYGSLGTNCIVYLNSANGAASSNWNSSVFGWSCTAPSPGGDGNFTNDPEFVNPTNNFHLQPASPGINSGNNSYVLGLTDLDGHPRISGGNVDLGAYEFQAQVTGTFDAWLQLYGLPTDGSADDADSDGTGMLNWQKWIAGLNPTNPASILALVAPAVSNDSTGNITVTWQSVNDRTYTLLRATDLTAPFTIIQSNIAGQSGATSFTDTTATGPGPFFYRVSVQ